MNTCLVGGTIFVSVLVICISVAAIVISIDNVAFWLWKLHKLRQQLRGNRANE